jgi:hypothetical protein
MCDDIRGVLLFAVSVFCILLIMIYDLAVIGGGTGGLVSAVAAKSLGAT